MGALNSPIQLPLARGLELRGASGERIHHVASMVSYDHGTRPALIGDFNNLTKKVPKTASVIVHF
jgi:hypothetical protein